MDALETYQKARTLAEANYRTRLTEAKRLMGEARIIYEDDLEKAREGSKKITKLIQELPV